MFLCFWDRRWSKQVYVKTTCCQDIALRQHLLGVRTQTHCIRTALVLLLTVGVYLVLCWQSCPGAAERAAAEGQPAACNRSRPPTRWRPGPLEALSTAGGGRGWARETEPAYSPLRERERDSTTNYWISYARKNICLSIFGRTVWRWHFQNLVLLFFPFWNIWNSLGPRRTPDNYSLMLSALLWNFPFRCLSGWTVVQCFVPNAQT